MGLLDIDKPRKLTPQYFKKNTTWRTHYAYKTKLNASGDACIIPELTQIYKRNISVSIKRVKESYIKYFKVGEIEFTFHTNTNSIFICFYPCIPCILTALGLDTNSDIREDEHMNLTKILHDDIIHPIIHPFNAKVIDDELCLEQIIEGIKITLIEQGFRIDEFKL